MITTTQELAQLLRDAIDDPNITPIHGPFDSKLSDGSIGACAAGAIITKAGFDPIDFDRWEHGIPAFRIMTFHPILHLAYDTLNCIISLWERYGWTWEQIAGWLDSLEGNTNETNA